MAAFSNPIQENIYDAVQNAPNEGYTTEQVAKMLAEIMVHIIE